MLYKEDLHEINYTVFFFFKKKKIPSVKKGFRLFDAYPYLKYDERKNNTPLITEISGTYLKFKKKYSDTIFGEFSKYEIKSV